MGNSAFEVGKQPCASFNCAPGGIAAAPEMGNRHQCMKCGGTVSFCNNCHYDHHANGYETCTPEARAKYDRENNGECDSEPEPEKGRTK